MPSSRSPRRKTMAASPRSGELRNATMDTLPVPVARQMIAHAREEMRRRHADDLDAIARELRELGKNGVVLCARGLGGVPRQHPGAPREDPHDRDEAQEERARIRASRSASESVGPWGTGERRGGAPVADARARRRSGRCGTCSPRDTPGATSGRLTRRGDLVDFLRFSGDTARRRRSRWRDGERRSCRPSREGPRGIVFVHTIHFSRRRTFSPTRHTNDHRDSHPPLARPTAPSEHEERARERAHCGPIVCPPVARS